MSLKVAHVSPALMSIRGGCSCEHTRGACVDLPGLLKVCVCSPSWVCMDFSGLLRVCVCSPSWVCMDLSGLLRVCVCSPSWVCVDFSRLLRVCVCSPSWVCVDFSGLLRVCVCSPSWVCVSSRTYCFPTPHPRRGVPVSPDLRVAHRVPELSISPKPRGKGMRCGD